MGIGINLGGSRSYKNSQVKKNTVPNNQANQTSNNNTSKPSNACNCKPPKVWPLFENPPAPPAVFPRPYPPDFVLPPDTAFISVNPDNTQLTIHHCCQSKPIEAYLSTYIFIQDYNLSSILSTYSQNYTNLKIYELSAYYGQNVRFCGKTPSAITDMYTILADYASKGGWAPASISAFIKNNPEYSMFADLRKGDLFYSVTSTYLSGSITSSLTLINEYICLNNILSTAIFEKLGSNNIDEIEKAINALNKKIDDTKSELNKRIDDLGTVFSFKGYACSGQQYKTLTPCEYANADNLSEAEFEHRRNIFFPELHKGNIYLSRNQDETVSQYLYLSDLSGSEPAKQQSNWEKLGSDIEIGTLIAETSAVTLLSANVYTDNAILSTITYTENLISSEIKSTKEDLSAYVEITSSNIIEKVKTGITSGFDGNMLYRDLLPVYPWQYFSTKSAALNGVYKGSVFTHKQSILSTNVSGQVVQIPEAQIVQYMYAAETADRETAAKYQSSYIKLGYRTDLSKYATVDFVKNYNTNLITETSTAILLSANVYTDQKVAGLGKVFNFKGYTSDHTSASLPVASLSTIGDIYLVDEKISGATPSGEIQEWTETAEYVGVSGVQGRSTKYWWQKLGVKTSVGSYATKAYVDAKDDILNNKIDSVSTTTDNLVTSINTKIGTIDNLYPHNDTVYGYINFVSGTLNTKADNIIISIGTKDSIPGTNDVYGYIKQGFNDISGVNGIIDTKVNTKVSTEINYYDIHTINPQLTNISSNLININNDLSGLSVSGVHLPVDKYITYVIGTPEDYGYQWHIKTVYAYINDLVSGTYDNLNNKIVVNTTNISTISGLLGDIAENIDNFNDKLVNIKTKLDNIVIN